MFHRSDVQHKNILPTFETPAMLAGVFYASLQHRYFAWRTDLAKAYLARAVKINPSSQADIEMDERLALL